ncbi:hypothetical protein [Comamonas aquatica]|nr:hypothetical protein [Comamonas aquatica]
MIATIDAPTIAKVIGSCMTVWVLGYGIGQSVAWVRKLRDVV